MFTTKTIDKFNGLDTPFYYYDLEVLKNTLSACRDASAKHGFHVHYAMKLKRPLNTALIKVRWYLPV
jgi:diaminopimelate decarboxylase